MRILEPVGDTRWANWAIKVWHQFARYSPRKPVLRQVYAADKLKKGDHLYVAGTLVSNVYEKEIGKGKNKGKVQITAWQIKAFSIRKLDRKESAPTAPATEKTQPEEAPF